MDTQSSDLMNAIDLLLNRIVLEHSYDINKITVEAKELIANVVQDVLQDIVFHIQDIVERNQNPEINLDTLYKGFLTFLHETKKEKKQAPYIAIDLDCDMKEKCKKEKERKLENRIDPLVAFLEIQLRLRLHVFKKNFATPQIIESLEKNQFMKENQEFITHKENLLYPNHVTTVMHKNVSPSPPPTTTMTEVGQLKNSSSSSSAISPTHLTKPMSQMKLEQSHLDRVE